jgi:hypothetical protein
MTKGKTMTGEYQSSGLSGSVQIMHTASGVASAIPQTSSSGGGMSGGTVSTTFCWPNGGWYPYPWPGYYPWVVPFATAPVTLPPRIQAALEALKLPNTAANKKLIASARKLYQDYLDQKIWC